MSQAEEENLVVMDEHQRHDETSVDATVREHSYLPGTMNPLFPASLLQQRRRYRHDENNNELVELAILELDGVILFPGGNSSLPLRLKHSAWIDYLGRKIQSTRGHPNTQVRIGIVTRERIVDTRRASTLRMAFRQAGGALLLHLEESHDEDDEEEEEVASEEENEDEASAEYHELMDEGEDSEQDDADEPVALPSENDLERAVEEAAEELNEDENIDQDRHRQHHQEGLHPVYYDMELIEENLDRIDQSLNDAQEALEETHGRRMDHQHLLNISRRLDRAETAQQPILHAFDTILDLLRSGHPLTSPNIAQILRVARRHRVRVAQQLDRMQSIHFRLRRLNSQTDSHSDDPLIGRIGTVAIVSYTFDETPADALNVGNGDGDRDELVVTVIGTNRFQIVSRVGEDDDDGAINWQPRLFGGIHDSSEVRMYMVRELPDKELPLPPSYIRSRRPLRQLEEADQCYFFDEKQTLRKLSNVCSTPQIAFKAVWPWRLVELIRSAMNRVSAFDGLTKNLASLQQDSPLLEPTAFSFWMASNMSLSQEEKLKLLQMPLTVERLRFILNHVLEEEENETCVCCKTCQSRLSGASVMFTVGGAEGTTGNYVNEYGIIHQTITLRDADENMLAYSGGPETKDSWFPGYSWTITYCRQCHSHLGWKFHLVRGSTSATEDRPEFFYGWSASSVTFRST